MRLPAKESKHVMSQVTVTVDTRKHHVINDYRIPRHQVTAGHGVLHLREHHLSTYILNHASM